jgi:hypothetical protein
LKIFKVHRIIRDSCSYKKPNLSDIVNNAVEKRIGRQVYKCGSKEVHAEEAGPAGRDNFEGSQLAFLEVNQIRESDRSEVHLHEQPADG